MKTCKECTHKQLGTNFCHLKNKAIEKSSTCMDNTAYEELVEKFDKLSFGENTDKFYSWYDSLDSYRQNVIQYRTSKRKREKQQHG